MAIKQKKLSAREELQIQFQTHKILTGRLTQIDKNTMAARNILHEELGYFQDELRPAYGFDDDTRDRLIAHARQDASHATMNTVSLMRWAKLQLLLSAASVVLLAYIAYRLHA